MNNRIEEIDFNVTNRCNMACSHCLFSAGPDRYDDLPLDLIKSVLIDGKKPNLLSISFYTLRMKFVKIDLT